MEFTRTRTAKITEYGRGQLMEEWNFTSPYTAAYGASVLDQFDPFLVNPGHYGSMASQKCWIGSRPVTLPKLPCTDYSRAIGLLILKEAAIYCTNVSVERYQPEEDHPCVCVCVNLRNPSPWTMGRFRLFSIMKPTRQDSLPGNKPFHEDWEFSRNPDISIVTIQSRYTL